MDDKELLALFAGVKAPPEFNILDLCFKYLIPKVWRHKAIPTFETLDKCFKYLIPAVRKVIKLESVDFYKDEGRQHLVFINYWPLTGDKIADNHLASFYGTGDTEVEALVNAVIRVARKHI